MPRERVAVQEVDWIEVLPWLGLVRTIIVAMDPRKLLLAAVGLIVTGIGWMALAAVFAPPPPENMASASDDVDLKRQIRASWQKPWEDGPPTSFGFLDQTAPRPPITNLGDAWTRVLQVPVWYVRPFLEVFPARSKWKAVSYALLSSLWTIAVWAFCGGTITRLAALRLAQDRRASLWSVAGQTLRRWRAYFFAPLFPLGGLFVLLVLPAAVVGLAARSEFLFPVVGVLWGIGLALGLLAAVFQVALCLGWPLMWATISTEASDAFDAFSRSFSYVTQRPFHFAFYVLFAAVLGTFGWLVATFFAELAMYLAVWAVSFGAPARTDELLRAANASSADSFGAQAVVFWCSFLGLGVIAYGHSFFWTAASGIYLLLRRDTDATPIDDIHLDEAEDPHALPPLKRDAAGVPVLDRETEQRAGAPT